MNRIARSRLARLLLTLAVALLPIFSGISGGLHFLLVRHVVCPAHGELVHADDPCATLPADSLAAQAGDESSMPALRADDEPLAGSDQHCAVGVLSRTSFVAWNLRESPVHFLRQAVVRAPRERVAPALSIEPIRLAPKQSPPA